MDKTEIEIKIIDEKIKNLKVAGFELGTKANVFRKQLETQESQYDLVIQEIIQLMAAKKKLQDKKPEPKLKKKTPIVEKVVKEEVKIEDGKEEGNTLK